MMLDFEEELAIVETQRAFNNVHIDNDSHKLIRNKLSDLLSSDMILEKILGSNNEHLGRVLKTPRTTLEIEFNKLSSLDDSVERLSEEQLEAHFLSVGYTTTSDGRRPVKDFLSKFKSELGVFQYTKFKSFIRTQKSGLNVVSPYGIIYVPINDDRMTYLELIDTVKESVLSLALIVSENPLPLKSFNLYNTKTLSNETKEEDGDDNRLVLKVFRNMQILYLIYDDEKHFKYDVILDRVKTSYGQDVSNGVKAWNQARIRKWISVELGLPCYASNFKRLSTGEALQYFSHKILKSKYGISSIGHRKKILNSLEPFLTSQPATEDPEQQEESVDHQQVVLKDALEPAKPEAVEEIAHEEQKEFVASDNNQPLPQEKIKDDAPPPVLEKVKTLPRCGTLKGSLRQIQAALTNDFFSECMAFQDNSKKLGLEKWSFERGLRTILKCKLTWKSLDYLYWLLLPKQDSKQNLVTKDGVQAVLPSLVLKTAAELHCMSINVLLNTNVLDLVKSMDSSSSDYVCVSELISNLHYSSLLEFKQHFYYVCNRTFKVLNIYDIHDWLDSLFLKFRGFETQLEELNSYMKRNFRKRATADFMKDLKAIENLRNTKLSFDDNSSIVLSQVKRRIRNSGGSSSNTLINSFTSQLVSDIRNKALDQEFL